MKILINVPDLTYPGGVSKYFQTINGKFQTEVKYVTIGARLKSKFPLAHIYQTMVDYIYFFSLIRSRKYDIVHLNPSLDLKAVLRDGFFLLIAKSFRTKVITFWHGWNDDFYNIISQRSWAVYLFKRIFFNSDAFIVLSNDVKNKLLVIGYKKPIFLETTLVNEAEIINRYDAKEKNTEHVHILFLCTIIREKGLYETIDAYYALRKEIKFVHLEIAGDGKELANAIAYANNKHIEGITFSGYLTGEKKINAFSKADIYLLPSYGEGMPISVLEAMASGLPIITTKVGGIKDFFLDGKMGFFVERKNSEDLAYRLKSLVENSSLRKDISFFNYHYARDRFMASKVLNRLENIYRMIHNTC